MLMIDRDDRVPRADRALLLTHGTLLVLLLALLVGLSLAG